MANELKIKRLVLGYLRTNCYILTIDKSAIVIDPADNYEEIENELNGLKLKGILVTHHHPDHIGALDQLEKKYNIKHNIFDISNFKFKVINTPGHTDDSISFYFEKEKLLFSGDFIFYHTIGRYDFENSSEEDMKKSLEIISKYPNDIIIYPGHGRNTILGEEKKYFDLYL